MDLRNLRTAVRTIAREGSVADGVLSELSAEEREAVVSLQKQAKKAGKLQAVKPPTNSALWF